MPANQPATYPFAAEKLDLSPLYSDLRKERPLSRVQLPYGEPAWLATRHEDARLVLADPRFSRNESLRHDEPRFRPFPTPPDALMIMDPPEHSRLRRLAAKAFTVKRVEDWRPRAERIAADLADGMLAKGAPADLVTDFALPLPISVISALLGVPFEDREKFHVWAEAFISTTKYTAEEAAKHRESLTAYMAGLIAEHRENPRDDLIGDLVAARDEDDRLSEGELQTMLSGILVGGFETTATQITNFVYVLLTHPEQLAALRTDLDLIPQAVEELLRFVPLTIGTTFARYALEDVEVGGVTVRAGEPVMVALHSANRDESVFTCPHQLDLERREAAHVAFGHGAHHCLGSPLARVELQVALHTLLTRFPGLRFHESEADVVWKSGVLTRGPERLPVAWDQP
ncbi:MULTISPECIES: cytochrome P450 [unclassified Streptomyces]|uniref:cytochrome P450 n=1 Tax=unclassified Streptomyces TaxID=2593676 RepID=UPI0023672B2B|nr:MULTISPECIES: cytochrome P450 [unclassified Streptomyces]MDF3143725.1 cytochrome P450 [Streptomyces sp. T21Q-yed]WDF38857.1 cytochrome P450 [Streptomyces sp. T12]